MCQSEWNGQYRCGPGHASWTDLCGMRSTPVWTAEGGELAPTHVWALCVGHCAPRRCGGCLLYFICWWKWSRPLRGLLRSGAGLGCLPRCAVGPRCPCLWRPFLCERLVSLLLARSAWGAARIQRPLAASRLPARAGLMSRGFPRHRRIATPSEPCGASMFTMFI